MQAKDLSDLHAQLGREKLLPAIQANVVEVEVKQEVPRPLIEFKTPLQLKNFVPAPGVVLVGDCHIVRGLVFVISGAPGVGKSRASVALAEAGATGNDWFG